MRILKILLIGLLMLGCSAEKEQVYTYELSKALEPYVYEYLNTLEKHDIKFKKQSFIVVFDADIMKTNLVGQAKGMFNDELVYVKINPELFGILTHKQKRHLIFHELSHDIFGIEHTQEIELMKPSMPNPYRSFKMDIDKEIKILMKYIKKWKNKETQN